MPVSLAAHKHAAKNNWSMSQYIQLLIEQDLRAAGTKWAKA